MQRVVEDVANIFLDAQIGEWNKLLYVLISVFTQLRRERGEVEGRERGEGEGGRESGVEGGEGGGMEAGEGGRRREEGREGGRGEWGEWGGGGEGREGGKQFMMGADKLAIPVSLFVEHGI